MPKKKAVKVEIVEKRRRKNPPRTAFKKGESNGHQFQPGQSGNPGGKPRAADDRVGKWLRVGLAERAPDIACAQMNLPSHSSWARVLAQRLLYLALGGDMAAYRELREWTEGSRVNLFGSLALDGDPDAVAPVIQIEFVESDGNGRPKTPLTIDATTPERSLPADVAD